MSIGHTLALDLDRWDVTLDPVGNIATATGTYAIAQNVANAVRLFTNDAWFDPDRGIPHFIVDLGRMPEGGVFRSRIRAAALTVDGVADAAVEIAGIENRTLRGTVSLTTTEGDAVDVAL